MRCISFQPTEGMFFTTTPLVGACKLNHSTRLVTHCLSSSLQVWIRLKKTLDLCMCLKWRSNCFSFILFDFLDRLSIQPQTWTCDHWPWNFYKFKFECELKIPSKKSRNQPWDKVKISNLASVAWCMQGLNSLTLAQLTCKLKLELELKLCVPPNLNDAVPEFNTEQWLGRFLGTIGGDPSVCKSNRLHVDILWFSFIKLGYILL